MLGLFWFGVAILICYTATDLLLYLSILSYKEKTNEQKKDLKLSVILACKNEADNLHHNLPFVLKQNHSAFEVIVVNDHSTDDSLDILSKFQSQYSNLKVLNNALNPSKKNAISLGIKHAKHEHLIFTDADCKPLSSEWLTTLQHYFSDKKSLILGYSPYKKEKTWLNAIIRFETYLTALNYFGLARLGQPYMGVGRNLAYHQLIFHELKGFSTHDHIRSGDDDLLVSQASGLYRIKSCLDPKTFVESSPESSFKSWISQKRRHISTATHYRLKHQLILGFQFILKFSFWFFLLPYSLFLLMNSQSMLCILILCSLIIKLVINKAVFNKLKVKDLWFQSILLEFQLICLQIYIFGLNLITPKKDW